jgi:hypothetical protein
MRIGINDRFEVPSRDLSHRNTQRLKSFRDISSTSSTATLTIVARLREIDLKQSIGGALHDLFDTIPSHDELAGLGSLTTSDMRSALSTRGRRIFSVRILVTTTRHETEESTPFGVREEVLGGDFQKNRYTGEDYT